MKGNIQIDTKPVLTKEKDLCLKEFKCSDYYKAHLKKIKEFIVNKKEK